MSRKTYRIAMASLFMLVLTFSYCEASGQDLSERAARASIRVSGEATVKAKPN